MNKLVKTITIEEAIELSHKDEFNWLHEFLKVFPNNFGINLCAYEKMNKMFEEFNKNNGSKNS